MKSFENAISLQYTPEEHKLADLTVAELEELRIQLHAEMQEIRYHVKDFSGDSNSIRKQLRIYEVEKKRLIDSYYVRMKRVSREINERKIRFANRNETMLLIFKRVARERLSKNLYAELWEEARERLKDRRELDKLEGGML